MTWAPIVKLLWLIGREYTLVNALLASAFSFAACALSSSVTSLRVRVCKSGEGSEVSEVEAGEGGAEDEDEASLMVFC